jgi:hypothetical protein
MIKESGLMSGSSMGVSCGHVRSGDLGNRVQRRRC